MKFGPEIGGLIRHALTTLGGILATHGVIVQSDIETFAAGVMVIIVAVWSVYQKRSAS